jgi:hypothetical protein
VIPSECKNDPTSHWQLDHPQECLNDDDIMSVYSVSDAVCNGTISQLIRELVEK